MKIGVTTWFRDMNYGTILQALALQTYLKKLGHEPSLINYLPPRNFPKDKRRTFMQKVQNKLDFICTNKYKSEHSDIFDKKRQSFFETIDSLCDVTAPVINDADFAEIVGSFDAFICGSDQIWNPNWMDKHFFLDYIDGSKKKKISYAPSIGLGRLPEQKIKNYADLLKDFTAVSLREEDAVHQLSTALNKPVKNVCDPVFLLNKTEWLVLSGNKRKINEPYLFYYFLTYNTRHWLAVKKFAEKHNLKIVGLPVVGREFYVFNTNEYINSAPLDFINYIHNAEYVVTDSFHATSFSILLETQFFVFEQFSDKSYLNTNSRIVNILNKFAVRDRLIEHNSTVIPELDDINFVSARKNAENFINTSKAYLSDSLK